MSSAVSLNVQHNCLEPPVLRVCFHVNCEANVSSPKAQCKSGLLWQVLGWPAPVSKGCGQVEGPSINSVAMDPELSFLVALSDKNMVIVWKKDESS